MYGPGMQTMDVALARSFAITERVSFQSRGEAFNALNKVNLGTPNRFVNEPQFGTITMAMTPGREIQLSAHFILIRRIGWSELNVPGTMSQVRLPVLVELVGTGGASRADFIRKVGELLVD